MTRPPLASLFAAVALGAISPAAAQTPPPARPVTFTGVRVVPSPAANIVRNIFARARLRFATCVPGDVTGTVGLRLATDANGQVSTATIRGTTFTGAQQPMAACVLGAARALRFPGSVQGTLDVELTVNFPAPPATAPPAP